MIDKLMTLHYKAVIDVMLPDTSLSRGSGDLFLRMMGIVHTYLNAATRLDIGRVSLEKYGQFTSPDGRQKALIASHSPTEGEPYPFLWAIKIVQYDDENRYRTWVTHIGINQDDDISMKLYFALLYADNVSGRLSDVYAPAKLTPGFIETLLRREEVICFNGNYILPTEPMHMSYEDIPYFHGMLFDPHRTLPLILHTCPHLIDPTGLSKRLMGNALLCHTSDMGVIIETSLSLPVHLQIEHDRIWFFAPMIDGVVRHMGSIDARDIIAKGPKKITDIISQAYSEHLRSEERNRFITTDHIYNLRNTAKAAMLEKDSLRLAEKVKELSTKIVETEREKDAAHQVLSSLKACGIMEYEELLTDCMTSNETTTKLLKDLTNRLYMGMGKNFLPSNHEHALFGELEKAIYACLLARKR